MDHLRCDVIFLHIRSGVGQNILQPMPIAQSDVLRSLIDAEPKIDVRRVPKSHFHILCHTLTVCRGILHGGEHVSRQDLLKWAGIWDLGCMRVSSADMHDGRDVLAGIQRANLRKDVYNGVEASQISPNKRFVPGRLVYLDALEQLVMYH
jgi:hypothetical protein